MSHSLLINITGPEFKGLSAAVTHLLADHGLGIRQLNQSAFQGTVCFYVKVEVATSDLAEEVLESINKLCQKHQLTVGYQLNSAEDELNDLIITLFSGEVTSEQLVKTNEILTEHGVIISDIKDLSIDDGLNPNLSNCRISSCLEFKASAVSVDKTALKQKLLDASAELGMDVVVQEASIYRSHRRLAVFDMDSTLIKAEVIDLLADAAGVGDKVAGITKRAMRGELDFNESFRERLGMLKGLDETVLAGIAEKLPIMEGAERLISSLNKLGYTTAILSGGFTYFAEYLQNKLGFDHIHANELEIVDGKVTGVVRGQIVNAERKAELLKQLAAEEGIELAQTIAVGDGANDLLMLDAAGLGVAFHAKPLVRQKAKHSVSTQGLDGVLNLLGLSEQEIRALQG